MSQIFHPSTNTISRVSIYGAIFLVAGSLCMMQQLNRSPYVTQAFVALLVLTAVTIVVSAMGGSTPWWR